MTQPKYRPYMTLPQIKAILELIEDMSNCISYTKPTEIKEVETTLKLLLIKAEAGAVTPNYVPTGNKPGPVSARDLVLSDSQSPKLTLEEAKYQASMYKQLGQEVPSHIQEVINKHSEE